MGTRHNKKLQADSSRTVLLPPVPAVAVREDNQLEKAVMG